MMPVASTFVLRSRRVITPGGEVLPLDITVVQGRITAVCPYGEAAPAGLPVEDVGDWVVMPGVVDTHVHVNEPGRTEWEGFITATQAAAAGGITMLVDMPLNCIPVTTTLTALDEKHKAVEGKLWIDCGFYGGVVPENSRELQPLMDAGVLGFKAFLIHSGIEDFPHVSEADLREAMPLIAKGRVPLLVHAELEHHPSCEGDAHPPRAYTGYLNSRPGRWEVDAIEMMIRLCRDTGCPVHIVHLSCADALPILAQARTEGLPVTVETCPHYLTLTAEQVPEGDTRFKCSPPIRESANRDRLWQGLQAGIIDFIVSDHSPCLPELKLLEQGDFQRAWGGISSLQLTLPLVWTEANRRGHSLSQVMQWLCQGPARFVHLDHLKGRIAPGYDADLVVWDPEARFTVTPEMLYHRHKVTPYTGCTLQGRVCQTYVRGQCVYYEGQLTPEPLGQIVKQSTAHLEGVSRT